MDSMLRIVKVFQANAGAISILSLITWSILWKYGTSLLGFVRKLILLAFTFSSFLKFNYLADAFFIIGKKAGWDVYIRLHYAQYKGTDWFEGFIYGLTICLMIGLNSELWRRELRPQPQPTPTKSKVTATATADPC